MTTTHKITKTAIKLFEENMDVFVLGSGTYQGEYKTDFTVEEIKTAFSKYFLDKKFAECLPKHFKATLDQLYSYWYGNQLSTMSIEELFAELENI